jgi:hypothetical protein
VRCSTRLVINERSDTTCEAHVPTKTNAQCDCDTCWNRGQPGLPSLDFRPSPDMMRGSRGLWLLTHDDLLRKSGVVVHLCHCGASVVGGISGHHCAECGCDRHSQRGSKLFRSHRRSLGGGAFISRQRVDRSVEWGLPACLFSVDVNWSMLATPDSTLEAPHTILGQRLAEV